MPDQISVSEFLSETTEDYNSPTTSSFTTRLQSCRNTVNVLEEVRPLCNCYTREHQLVLLCKTQITVPVQWRIHFFHPHFCPTTSKFSLTRCLSFEAPVCPGCVAYSSVDMDLTLQFTECGADEQSIKL